MSSREKEKGLGKGLIFSAVKTIGSNVFWRELSLAVFQYRGLSTGAGKIFVVKRKISASEQLV